MAALLQQQQQETRLSSTRVLKACDACKVRKVRCSGGPAPCTRCVERKTTCHFSRMHVPRRQKVATQLLVIDPKPGPGQNPTALANSEARKFPLQKIHVDRLLANARTRPDPQDKPFSFKSNGLFLTSVNYGLSFFSDSRLSSLSARLQNNKLHDLVKRVSHVLQSRAKPREAVATGSLTRKRENLELFTDSAAASKWIQIYFERVHPIYPFLDRAAFEAAIKEDGFQDKIRTNRAWSALYHCVLALGCQHDGGGSFEPASGQAWKLFSKSLALYPDLLGLPDSLLTVQALTAMAIYSSGLSCLSIEYLVISEAARRIQRHVRTSVVGNTANSLYRTFWVLYSMEKVSSFYLGRSSLFVDHDISCPIPFTPDALFGEFDWFLSYARHSRFLSRVLTSLFSAGVIGNPSIYYLDTIDQLNDELETWRLAISENIRPGKTFQAHKLHEMLQGDATRQVIVWTHYLFSGARIMLARATLQLAASVEHLVPSSQQAECKTVIMEEARSILELTRYVDAEPWTSVVFIAGVPVIALFTLFELVIFNPKHHETRGNLALLDIAGGYFSRLEYASHGSLHASLVSEFAYIAREYVNSLHNPEASGPNPNAQQNNLPSQQRHSKSMSAAAMVLRSPSLEKDHTGGSPNQQDIPIPATIQPLVPNAEQALPMMGDADMVPLESPSPLSMDGLNFPMGEAVWGVNNDYLLGTDVMDLFNYSLTNMDSFFAQFHDGSVHDGSGTQMGG